MTLYQKLAKIRTQVAYIQNNAFGHGYTYTSDEAILSRIHDAMAELEVSLIPMVTPSTIKLDRYETRETKLDQSGAPYEKVSVTYVTVAEMVYRWINDADPTEYIDVTWPLVGIQASASQSFGSGLTYSMRYFLLKYFNIATSDDDPDAYAAKQQENAKIQKAADARKESAKINEQTAEFIQTVLLTKPDAREDLLNVCRKYVKRATKQDDPNFNKIEDPAIAQKLYDELKKTYGGND